jgi:putative transposase
MPTKKILTPLLPDCYFHVFNRGNNGENLFFNRENYRYFLRKYQFFLGLYVNTYAYCLIGNHFHFLIKVKDKNDENYHLKVSHQFRRFFQSYALAINNQEGRSGSLFRKQFRRIAVNNMDYLRRLVFYIHFNPQKHQIVQDFRKYPYSSYRVIKEEVEDLIVERGCVISWFNDLEDFINYHDVMHNEKKLKMICLEDD